MIIFKEKPLIVVALHLPVYRVRSVYGLLSLLRGFILPKTKFCIGLTFAKQGWWSLNYTSFTICTGMCISCRLNMCVQSTVHSSEPTTAAEWMFSSNSHTHTHVMLWISYCFCLGPLVPLGPDPGPGVSSVLNISVFSLLRTHPFQHREDSD